MVEEIEIKKYISTLLAQQNIVIANHHNTLFDDFVNDETNINAVKQIRENQKMITEKWQLRNSINHVIEKQLIIPNATVGKAYKAELNFEKNEMGEIIFAEFNGLEKFGLAYNYQSETISGLPTLSGDFKITMHFRVKGEEENSPLHEKQINLVINADPKSLWKNIPSTQTASNFWKPDNTEDFQALGDKHIVVASKRGRSHGNVGSFRDDDFAFKHFETTGWSVVCVADGAGSASVSRHGSKLACDAVIEYFTDNFTEASLLEFDAIVAQHYTEKNDETSKQISHFVYSNLSKAAHFAHKQIDAFATLTEKQIKEFHSTLIFAVFKKYEFGYAILTFGVGDCPIGIMNKDETEIKLMNWLDVGEYGGGTRFITMAEIFSSDKFTTRFGFKLIDDFSYLFLMTDGIYDPKFVVEANLEKVEKWKEFLLDMKGNNEDKHAIEFSYNNPEIAQQLSTWMDFWSPGNHDDRTLAIVF